MPTLGGTFQTLADVMAQADPKGGMLDVVEIMNEVNDVIQDIPWVESNQPTSHITAQRTGLPTAAGRDFNAGVAPSKGKTQKVTDTMAMIHSWSRVDRDLAELAPDVNKFRMTEDVSHVEAMTQTFTDMLFYGDPDTDQQNFLGLTPRFNALSNPQVFNGGSNDTDNSSIWLVGWGPNTVHGIYPKSQSAGGMQAGGINYYNHGEEIITESDGKMWVAYVGEWKWHCGLVVKDPRYVTRCCNIEISDLLKDAGSGSADLIDLMTRMIEEGLWNLSGGRPIFYTTRKVRSFLRRQITNKVAASTLTMESVAGRPVMMFDGIPVRRVDSLTAVEALVS